MFDSTILKTQYKNLLGFRQHFDTAEINIGPDLTTTDSGEYYQDKSPALRLDYIQATLSSNQDLEQYLNEKRESGIVSIFNDILQSRQVANYGKTLLEKAQLLNRHSWLSDKIMNLNRFVGFQIHLRNETALQCVIDEIGLQLDGAQELTLYLFHSQKEEPIGIMQITTTGSGWTWNKSDFVLKSYESEEYNGGVFILGYYQEDLVTQAINYTNFNWDIGECAGCSSGSNYYKQWKSIRGHYHIYPLYVSSSNFEKGKMFDLQKAIYSNDTSWGLNLKVTAKCDLTAFFVENKFVFKNLLGLKVAHLILNDMKFSQETNFVEENLKMMIIRDLEGDKETNALNISQQYNRELKAVNFNISSINNSCLNSVENTFYPTIGQV